MAIWDGVVKLIGGIGSVAASVTTRGSKGAVGVEILDSSGNQITSFGPTPSGATYQVLSYDASNNVISIVYYTSNGGTLIATDTITYDGNNNPVTITRT
jgi:hypothetical protein